MAKRGRKKGSKNKKKIDSIDLNFIVMICITIFLGVIIYGNTGTFSEKLSPVIGGIFGPLKQVLPIITLLVAIFIARGPDEDENKKMFEIAVLLLLILAAYSLFNISSGNMQIADSSYFEDIKMGYELGIRKQGGGALGAMVASPLVSAFGIMGATIIDISLIIVMVILLFDISPTEYVASAMDEMEENNKEKRKIRQARKEEQEEMAPKYIEKQYSQVKYDVETGKLTEEPIKQSSIFGGLFNIFKKKDKDGYSLQGEELEQNANINLDAQLKSGEEPPEFNMPEEQRKDEGNIEQIGRAVFETKQKETAPKVELEMTVQPDDIRYEDYVYDYPPIDLLKKGPKKKATSKKVVEDTANMLQKTLYSFGVSAKVINASVGPAITRYELKPAVGVKVSKISNLADDLALNLAAETLRIEAPIPGKRAVGIEVPNEKREMVHLGDVIDSPEFRESKSKISFALGKGVGGEIVIADIHKMPHLLIAGSTGSGKSVCVNTIITSIIYKADPNEVKFLMIDPKVVELSMYNSIPHLLVPVITDVQKAEAALKWAVSEMINRYTKFKKEKVKDIQTFNEKMLKEEKMPNMIIIIDELADLMMASAKEVEELICRIAQMGRAAGMHLVVATQRPSVDVITGLIKANIPSRIAFAVTSSTDSRTIIDKGGAESLLGKGDMLYVPIGEPKPLRVQGAFIDEKEILKVVDYIKRDDESETSINIQKEIEKKLPNTDEIDDGEDADERDPILIDAIDKCVKDNKASISFLRRKFKIGDSRAGRIMDTMEEMGIVSAQEGNKARKVLVSEYEWQQVRERYENGEDGNIQEDIIADDEYSGNELGNENALVEEREPKSKGREGTNTSGEYNVYKDPILKDAISRVVREEYTSNSFLERIYNISSEDAEKYLSAMSSMGVVSAKDDNNLRKVLINEADWNEIQKTYSGVNKHSVNNDILAKNSNFDDSFKIKSGTLNITKPYVEKIIDITTDEQYFMDAIEDMIEDDEISKSYLRRKYRISDERCDNILKNMQDMNMISMGSSGNAIVTITPSEWNEVTTIFDEIVD